MAADEYQLRKDIDRIKTLADKLEELTDSKYDAEDFNIFDIIAAHQELMNRVEEIETHEGIIVDADGATVTEPDKYVSGLYENFPHAFSDLFNYFKRYYTNTQGDEVGEQDQYDNEGHHAASVQWYIERIADKLYGHDENLAVLNSHSHGVWEVVEVNFGALYVNEAIRMCELRFVRPSNSYTANKRVTVPVTISGDVTVNPIAESYPPVDTVRVPGYRPEVVLSLGTNGSVSIRSSVDLSSVVISGMFRWHY